MAKLDMVEYQKIIDICKETAIKKNISYGSSNLEETKLMGIIVRMNDKMARLKNLTIHNMDKSIDINILEDESLTDTLMDLLNYVVFAIMMRNGKLTVKEKNKNNS